MPTNNDLPDFTTCIMFFPLSGDIDDRPFVVLYTTNGVIIYSKVTNNYRLVSYSDFVTNYLTALIEGESDYIETMLK